MALLPQVKDRLFTLLCVAAALVVLVVGFSRGNTKVAFGGAAIFVGYALLQSLARRLTPGARLVIGSEADAAERLVQSKATRLAGQVTVGQVAVAGVMWLWWDSQIGLWVALACSLVLVTFVLGLAYFSRAAKKTPIATSSV